MTSQICEKLIYLGKKVSIATEPLNQYIRKKENEISFVLQSTGCWRGYVGSWKIEKGQLFLTGLKGSAIIYDKEKYLDEFNAQKQQMKSGLITSKEYQKIIADLKKRMHSEGKKIELSVAALFPGKKKIFADWYSGTLRIPQGEILDRHPMGHFSTYERDLILEFKEGYHISSRRVSNSRVDKPTEK